MILLSQSGCSFLLYFIGLMVFKRKSRAAKLAMPGSRTVMIELSEER